MAGLQCGEGRTVIDSVVWAQYINVTDRHTDSHVAMEIAALIHCVERQLAYSGLLKPCER